MADQTIVSWCPGAACDPCSSCYWGIDPDPTIMCIAPSIGLGATTDESADRGQIVAGYVDVSLAGSFYGPDGPPTSPPIPFVGLIWVQVNGANLFSIDPSAGSIQDFEVQGNAPAFTWTATARVPVDCIMLGLEDGAFYLYGWNCVYPYSGAIISKNPITGVVTPAGIDAEIVIPPQDPVAGGLIPIPPGGLWNFPHVPGAVPVVVTITGRLYWYANNATGELAQFPPDHWAELVEGDGFLSFVETFPSDFAYAWFKTSDYTMFTWSFVTWGAPADPLAQPTFVKDTDPGLVAYNVIGASLGGILYRSQ